MRSDVGLSEGYGDDGWQGHERPFAFEPDMDYAAGAHRFLTGTPNVSACYAATAGYEIVAPVKSGGMGALYVARQKQFSSALRNPVANSPDSARRATSWPGRALPETDGW